MIRSFLHDKAQRFELLVLSALFFSIPIEPLSWHIGRLYLYPSSIGIALLFLFGSKETPRKWLQCGGVLLLILLACVLHSIFWSELYFHLSTYLRASHLLFPILLFLFVANGPLDKKEIFSIFIWVLLIIGLSQSALALCQYSMQRLTGFEYFNHWPLITTIPSPGGKLWIGASTSIDPLAPAYRSIGSLGIPISWELFSRFLFFAHPICSQIPLASAERADGLPQLIFFKFSL